MNVFDKLFLAKHEKELNKITGELAMYWERTNDFTLACVRYVQDLNSKFQLGFSPDEIVLMATTIINKCYLNHGLSNANTMLLYGEFIYYAVFGGKLPSYVRHKKEVVFQHLDNFDKYVIENPAPWNDKITKVLDRNCFMY